MKSNEKKISLVNNTISKSEINEIAKWLKKNERLTKGNLTIEFEKQWSKWLGRKYSLFVNSGSSANLAMFYALILSGKLRNNKIIVPSVSWVTTVSPVMQLGLEPILCDSDKDTLGLDINHLKKLIETEKPSALILVHVLGVPNKMNEIITLCNDNDIILLEDSCESVGSEYNNIKTGCFGLMSSFSTYYGHHFSTIEGGLISTDDEDMYNILLSIRSHGWDRDLNSETREKLRSKYNIDEFRGLYTFYYPGFNLRSTDLQAKIGLLQLDKLDSIVENRVNNFKIYHDLIKNDYWKISPCENTIISNFSYPIINPNLHKIVDDLTKNNIECRPLVCGSIGRQPFYIEKYGIQKDLNFADIVHDYGLYVPNNHELKESQIKLICKVINRNI